MFPSKRGRRGEAPDRDEGAVLSALRLIFKSSAFEPRIIMEGVAGKDACK